jgi:transposase-like protein
MWNRFGLTDFANNVIQRASSVLEQATEIVCLFPSHASALRVFFLL